MLHVAPRFRIKTNTLLRAADKDKKLGLDDLLELRRVLSKATDDGPAGISNLLSVSDDEVRAIHARHGEPGLFKFWLLANSHGTAEFAHFAHIIQFDGSLLRMLGSADSDVLQCDTEVLRQGERLQQFDWNVMQPSLSRKLYNPGCHEGYLVYGIGGPRILVSHSFRGCHGEYYDIYANSVDIVISLNWRGYFGSFLFLAYLSGLDGDFGGVPGWLAWFSLLAGHSDIVLFIKLGPEFGPAQQQEIEFTPDRVQKKIVEFPPDELRWARQYGDEPEPTLHGIESGVCTPEEFNKCEAQRASPFVEQYVKGGFPKDRLIRILEDGSIEQYPLDYPAYT